MFSEASVSHSVHRGSTSEGSAYRGSAYRGCLHPGGLPTGCLYQGGLPTGRSAYGVICIQRGSAFGGLYGGGVCPTPPY